MKTTPFDVNAVTLRGKVTGIYATAKITRVYLSIKDFQQKANEDGWIKRNNVSVTFYGYEGVQAVKGIGKGDNVTVTGVIQNIRDIKTGKWHQECWGLTLTKTLSLLEIASEGSIIGSVYPEDENTVILRGKVVSVHLYNNNWLNFTIKTRVQDANKPKVYYNSVNSVSAFSRTAIEDAAELERGGVQVMVVGKLEGIEKEDENGKKQVHENVTVRDFRIINKRPPQNKADDVLLAAVQQATELPLPEPETEN